MLNKLLHITVTLAETPKNNKEKVKLEYDTDGRQSIKLFLFGKH